MVRKICGWSRRDGIICYDLTGGSRSRRNQETLLGLIFGYRIWSGSSLLPVPVLPFEFLPGPAPFLSSFFVLPSPLAALAVQPSVLCPLGPRHLFRSFFLVAGCPMMYRPRHRSLERETTRVQSLCRFVGVCVKREPVVGSSNFYKRDRGATGERKSGRLER